MWPRRQLPAYSPMPGRAIGQATLSAWRGDDPRAALAALLAEVYNAQSVQLTQSGTAALQLALRTARMLAGDGAIALPAFGCYDLAAAAAAGQGPVTLYDIDPDTLGPDLDSLSALANTRARVIVVAPIAGVPVDWEAIEDCARGFGAVVVEDAAQCHGASWMNRPCGGLGTISVLSFGRGKGWTGARGGAVLIRDDTAARFLGHFPLPEHRRLHGAAVMATAAAISLLSHPSRYGIPASIPGLGLGETRYRAAGSVLRMSRVAASMLLANREDATAEASQRRRNAEELLSSLSGVSYVRCIQTSPHCTPGYLRLPLRVTGAAGDAARSRRARRLGVSPTYPATLATIAALRQRLQGGGWWPGAETLVRELAFLPTHSLVTRAERAGIVGLLRGARWRVSSAGSEQAAGA